MMYLQPIIQVILAKLGRSLDDLMEFDHKAHVRMWESIAPIHVEAELAVERDAHYEKRIQGNDMFDIGFLSVAIPYCDIVVTERFWCHIANSTSLTSRYDTTMLTRLGELRAIVAGT